MPQVTKTVLVPFSAQQMYGLVAGIEDYPAFLPWCAGAQILERKEDGVSARLEIDFKGIKQSFATENTNQQDQRIDIRLKEGPFRSLQGHWRFTPLASDACRIDFELEYHFSSGLLEKVIGPVFGHIAATFVDAFVRRAESLYQS
jgi:ribosome-associated toxin RatA of RatAB toxin-antitoxin module